VQSKGAGTVDDLAPDLPGPNDPEGLAVDSVCLREFLLVPLPRAQGGHVVGDAPVQGQQQPEDQFGDGDRVLSRAIADEDAPSVGRFDVDGVHA
jgi:hypothetical protein